MNGDYNEVVRRFLTSVLLVDDFEAVDEQNGVGIPPAQHADETDPVRKSETDDDSPPSVERQGPRKLNLEPPPVLADDRTRVTEAFARAELLCMVLDPGVNDRNTLETRRKVLLGAARRADIVVLDWKLYPTEEPAGTLAIEVLDHLVHERPSALQMVCIYTADPDLVGVIDQVATHFEESIRLDEHRVQVRSLNIVVIGKADYQLDRHSDEQGLADSASFDEFPRRLISEFARAAAGLVPQFAMAALGAVRERSWLLSETFAAECDAGLITHFACLPDANDGLRHLADAFTDELGFVVAEDELVRSTLSMDQVRRQANTLRRSDEDLKEISNGSLQSAQIDAAILDQEALPRSAFKFLTELHTPVDSPTTSLASNLRFAHLLQSRRRYGDSPPALTLGTVVQKRASTTSLGDADERSRTDANAIWKEDETAVCMMPLCDTDNLKGASRRFFFAPLHLLAEGKFKSGHSHFAVATDQGLVLARVDAKLFRLHVERFSPPLDGPRVLARRSTGDEVTWHFESDDHWEYLLLGELRPVYRQRLSDSLAADAGRIGADLPEWIRRGED